MVLKNLPKISMKFYCKSCDYGTGKLSEYNKHLLTAKHKNGINGIQKSPENRPYICVCGKKYKQVQDCIDTRRSAIIPLTL